MATKTKGRTSGGRSSGKSSGKRELVNTGTDKRYVRRDSKGQFKESDDVGVRRGRKVVVAQEVPRRRLVNDIRWHALGIEVHADDAGRVFVVDRERRDEAGCVEALGDLVAEQIGADRADDDAAGAELLRVKREVRRRAAELLTGGEQVPQDFAQPDGNKRL